MEMLEYNEKHLLYLLNVICSSGVFLLTRIRTFLTKMEIKESRSYEHASLVSFLHLGLIQLYN